MAAAWPAGAAYLPLLGPGPLRYERPVRAARAPVAPAVEAPAASVAEAPSSGDAAPPTPPPAPAAVVEPAPAVSTNVAPGPVEVFPGPSLNVTNVAAPPAPSSAQVSAEPEITPQMLVQYFKMPAPVGGTNSAGVMVTVPLFQPPQPGRIPPSSARYETPEPRRPAP
ncbi:MAG: hypothetical protein N3J91_07040 [Verrucomicrobiae bacterium]|nr:hypothetical protein [Verrucomicrobiae bacterium]